MNRSSMAAIAVILLLGCGETGGIDPNLTVNVAVDDETGAACATKADGRYRCWTAEPLPPLPEARYRRVQAALKGPIGLTDDGRVLAEGFAVPADLPPVIELKATNMWGAQGICYRTSADESLSVFRDRGSTPPDPLDPPTSTFEGPFRHVTCAFEGMVCGARPGGSAWCNVDAPFEGSGWRQLALGLQVFCGLKEGGDIVCGKGYLNDAGPVPVFPAGPYQQVAVTYKVACGLTVHGELRCLRRDGAVVPTPAGRYTFIDAGLDVVCAIRADGTSGCWRHDLGGDDWNQLEVSRFDPIVPPVDVGW